MVDIQKLAKAFQFSDSLFLFLSYEFLKTWNYVADRNTHVCMCIHVISRFCLN